MENIKLSDKDRQMLNRYNHLLMAIVGEEGIYGYGYVSEDEGVYDFSGFQPVGPHGYSRRGELELNSEGYNLLYNLIDVFFEQNSNEFVNYLYCDDCTGYGHVNVTYNPFNSTFSVNIDIGTRGYNTHEHDFTFERLKNQPQGQWGEKYDELKKLGDSNFIEKMKKDYGNTLEISYEGGGDSGQINDYGDTDHGSVKINNDIEYIGYEVIAIYYSGWENNEGGDGRITFDFENKTVTLHHTENIEDSETEEIGEFKLI